MAVIVITVGQSVINNYMRRMGTRGNTPDITTLLDFLLQDAKYASAELNTLTTMLEASGTAPAPNFLSDPEVTLFLLVTATPEGRACGEALRRYLEAVASRCAGEPKNALERYLAERSVVRMQVAELDGVGSNPTDLQTRGLYRLHDLMAGIDRDHKGEHILLCVSGGFKAVTSYASIMGMLLEWPTVYLSQDMRPHTAIVFPRLPINIDFSLIRNHDDLLSLAQEGALSPDRAANLTPELQALLERRGHTMGFSPAGYMMWLKYQEWKRSAGSEASAVARLLDTVDLELARRFRELLSLWVTRDVWQGNLVPQLVLHDAVHALNVDRIVAPLVDDPRMHRLTGTELFILGCAAWLHDMGHRGGTVTTKDTEQQVVYDPMFARKYHGLVSHNIIGREYASLLGFSEAEAGLAQAIARVCLYHQRLFPVSQGSQSDEFLGITWDPLPEEVSVPCRGSVRMRMLVALLRLADGCDYQVNRVVCREYREQKQAVNRIYMGGLLTRLIVEEVDDILARLSAGRSSRSGDLAAQVRQLRDQIQTSVPYVGMLLEIWEQVKRSLWEALDQAGVGTPAQRQRVLRIITQIEKAQHQELHLDLHSHIEHVEVSHLIDTGTPGWTLRVIYHHSPALSDACRSFLKRFAQEEFLKVKEALAPLVPGRPLPKLEICFQPVETGPF